MPKVTVDIGDKELDAETRKEIIRLRSQVVHLKAGNQKETVQRARKIIGRVSEIHEAYKEEFDDFDIS